MRKLNTNTRNQIVNEVYNNLYVFHNEEQKKYNKIFNKVFRTMLKSPLCYDIGYGSKYQNETIKHIIDNCVNNIATQLTRNQLGNSPRNISWGEISDELALFETTVDFDSCEDAYEVIECLYNFFVKQYK